MRVRVVRLEEPEDVRWRVRAGRPDPPFARFAVGALGPWFFAYAQLGPRRSVSEGPEAETGRP